MLIVCVWCFESVSVFVLLCMLCVCVCVICAVIKCPSVKSGVLSRVLVLCSAKAEQQLQQGDEEP